MKEVRDYGGQKRDALASTKYLVYVVDYLYYEKTNLFSEFLTFMIIAIYLKYDVYKTCIGYMYIYVNFTNAIQFISKGIIRF